MTTKELADLIFPNITKTIEDYEKEYGEKGTVVINIKYNPDLISNDDMKQIELKLNI